MKRGEVWSVAGGPGFGGKQRPAVIIQDDAFPMTASVTVCGFTSTLVDAPLLRLRFPAGGSTGLREDSDLMIDKPFTLRRDQLGQRIGTLSVPDLVRLNRALLVFLGLATPVRPRVTADI
ncbi:MAG: hypothetical protein RL026_1451 [Pseudomonadota bacterium]|jgi:mRNA interferase MazF